MEAFLVLSALSMLLQHGFWRRYKSLHHHDHHHHQQHHHHQVNLRGKSCPSFLSFDLLTLKRKKNTHILRENDYSICSVSHNLLPFISRFDHNWCYLQQHNTFIPFCRSDSFLLQQVTALHLTREQINHEKRITNVKLAGESMTIWHHVEHPWFIIIGPIWPFEAGRWHEFRRRTISDRNNGRFDTILFIAFSFGLVEWAFLGLK